jgi:RNA-directed DNA polymerase
MPKEGVAVTATAAMPPSTANGPEDYAQTWHSIDWAKVEASVRRLRQRIFTAMQEGDLKKVRNFWKAPARPACVHSQSQRKAAPPGYSSDP